MASFASARSYRLLIGQHRGKVLDDIGSTDEGLKYLDWLVGQSWLYDFPRKNIQAYLSDPAIKKELRRILGGESS